MRVEAKFARGNLLVVTFRRRGSGITFNGFTSHHIASDGLDRVR